MGTAILVLLLAACAACLEQYGREDFLKNMFLRLALLPSGSNEVVHLISTVIQLKYQHAHLKDLNFTYEPFNLSFYASNITVRKLVFEKNDTSGINPVSNTAANFSLPKVNLSLTFNYTVKFGFNDTTAGNGTFYTNDLDLVATMVNIQEEDAGGKHFGRIFLECEKVHLDFSAFEFKFSNPFTQSEWDIFFDHPKVIKSFADSIILFAIEQAVYDLDLRLLLNVVFGKGIGMIVGVSEQVTFPKIDLPEPNSRYMDLKLHMILTLQSGNPIDGIFPNKMDQPMLSYNYSSLAVNTDVFNKFAQAFFYDNMLNFSFNQRIFDTVHFDLLRLDTTALKEFFPKIEDDYSPGLGVWLQIQTAAYDKYTSYLRNTAGQVVLLLQTNINVYVDTNSYDKYYHGRLEECIHNSTCIYAYGINVDLYLKLPIQLSKEKQLLLGYLDADITKVSLFYTARKSFDTEVFRSKLNNFIDISLPQILPDIDLSFFFPYSSPSIDVLDDQRIILASERQ